ncbi:MAG: ABC transporter ATP-binding protein [Chitinophagaceae bacterium]
MSSVLSIDKITKFYGSIRALNEVSFNVQEGSVFGILGPNGSGKTTMLGIVMDILKASSGNYLWRGQPGSAPMRQQIGTLLETPNFYHYLSGEKNLRIAAEVKQKGQDEIEKVLHLVNLYQRKDSKFSTYSLGMKQRLAIASTLLGSPEILVFDEPTNGLDPAGIAEIRELIKELNRQGKTIIMASHILDEVEKVCTHVAIIQKGELKASGSVQDILDRKTVDETVFELAADDLVALQTIVQQMNGVLKTSLVDNYLQAVFANSVTATSVNQFCFEKGIVLSKLNIKRKSLETTFLEITGTKSER